MKVLLAFAFLMALGTWTHADQARVFVQWIELSHPDLTTIISNTDTASPQPHADALSLVTQGKAKILDTNVIVSPADQNSTLDSVTEFIFPIENQQPGIPGTFAAGYVPDRGDPIHPMERIMTCFETRNTGVMVKVNGWARINSKTISLRITPESVSLLRIISLRDHVDVWGDASWRTPIFEAWNVNTQHILTHGHYELAGVIRPKTQPPAPAVENRILVFVRADVLSSEK